MFNKIIGNVRVKEVFKRLLAENRLPHSLLFAGQQGVGKKTFALEIAKTVVCQNPQDGEACDQCGACKRAETFAFPKPDDRDAHKKVIFSEHPDVGLIVPYNKNILVDAIRELETEANFLPYEGRARFFIINDAEKMNDAAANALLKTLEEPSPTVYIFLVTSRPAALLATIRSRCQIVRFAPLEAKQIEGYLENTNQYSVADAELLSRLARGSLAAALEMDLSKFRERRESVYKVLENLLAGESRAPLLKAAEEITDAKNKDVYEEYLEILQTLIHDVWLLRLGQSDEQIVNRDLKSKLSHLAQNTDDAARLARWLREIETLRENLSVNVNKKISTDALFMQMSGV